MILYFDMNSEIAEKVEKLKKYFENRDDILMAFLFGSYVKGSMGAESDVDVLVVGSHKAIDVQSRLAKLQKKFDRDINVVDMTEQEFKKKQTAKDPLVTRVLNGLNIKLI